jgi:hypothetical protein
MTAHTDGTLMDDAELIEMLQRVATERTPPLRYEIESLLARGRRARRRRQALMVPASGLAVAGVAALVFAVAHGGTDQRQQLFLSPAASGTQDSPQSTAPAVSDQQILQDAFGDDFVISPGGETGPTPGNVTVRPGSPSADGLPNGVTLWTQLLYGGPGGIPASELEQFCAPMVEKGLHRSACTQHVLPSGQVVQVQRGRVNLGEYKPEPKGSHPTDGIRVIYAQTNGQLVIVDLVATEEESSSTPEGRAAVRAWLDGMTLRLAAAATDPRIDAMTGVNYEPKGARATSKTEQMSG